MIVANRSDQYQQFADFCCRTYVFDRTRTLHCIIKIVYLYILTNLPSLSLFIRGTMSHNLLVAYGVNTPYTHKSPITGNVTTFSLENDPDWYLATPENYHCSNWFSPEYQVVRYGVSSNMNKKESNLSYLFIVYSLYVYCYFYCI